MNELISTATAALTMSSNEIATLCEKEHKNVLRDIRVMLAELKDGSDLSHVRETRDSRGYTAIRQGGSVSLPPSDGRWNAV